MLQFEINAKLTQNNTKLSFLTFIVFVKGKIEYKLENWVLLLAKSPLYLCFK